MRLDRTEINWLVWAVLAIAAAACLPWVASPYYLTIGVTIAMFTVLATSWAIFSGPTHYISLATTAFYGVGTYTTGMLIDVLPYWSILLVAGAIGAVGAALVGLATLVWLAGWLIGRSRLGSALRIIGDDEEVARHSGINTVLAKVVLFMLPGAAAAITGAMLAPRFVYIEPAIAFSPMLSFQVVIMALLGGTGRLWGPLFGVIPFTFLWEGISASFPNQTTLLLGVAFLIIIYLLPRGFVGLLQDLRTRTGGRLAEA